MPNFDEEVLNRLVLRPRRTKAQIAATAEKKSAKAEEAKLNSKKSTQLTVWIAMLENKMHNDEQQAKREAAHPPVIKGIVLVMQPPSKCMKTHLFKHM
jgi:hypothetical protein